MKTLLVVLLICGTVSENFGQHWNVISPGDQLYVWAKSGLRLRKEGNPESPVMVTMPFGAQVIIIDTDGSDLIEAVRSITLSGKTYPGFDLPGGWYKIKFKSFEGYAFSGYLSKLPPLQEVPDTSESGQGQRYIESIWKWAERSFGKPDTLEYTKPTQVPPSDYHKMTLKYSNGALIIMEGETGSSTTQVSLLNCSLNEGFLFFDRLFDFTSNYANSSVEPYERMRLIDKNEQDYLRFWIGGPKGECEIKRIGFLLSIYFWVSC
ncbi:MAG: SH3 domain-containing protein [Saprospiraceae bacterium]|nr:SH3 domain-containing protein [Saprospiraceae bacterium]